MLSNQNEKVLKGLFHIRLLSDKESKENLNQKNEPRRIISKKIGRNSACPCGSGKKYKHCHGS